MVWVTRGVYSHVLLFLSTVAQLRRVTFWTRNDLLDPEETESEDDFAEGDNDSVEKLTVPRTCHLRCTHLYPTIYCHLNHFLWAVVSSLGTFFSTMHRLLFSSI